MKKVVLIASVLLVAVFSTACINNFAVQDLNNKAKMYADKGDYVQAIERLKSSIDLDSSIVETHYNLAVAYTQIEDYINAVEEYKKVIQMKPDMADAYYSLATAENNLAVDIETGKVRVNDDGELYTVSPDAEEATTDELTADQTEMILELYSSAVENYNKYLELNPEAADKQEVETMVKKIQESKISNKERATD